MKASLTQFPAPAAPRPRRESAHLRRRARRTHWRRFLALALAIAVPAFAAPAEWGDLRLSAPAAEPAPQPKPMGFETPGESFPGSAFYYLEDTPYTPLPVEREIHSDADPAPATDEIGGPAARSLVVGGSATDQARALTCMTMAIYYEAASESDAGQRAVAQVVLNRVAHPAFPDTVCGVVFQGSERSTGCQFSFACDGSLDRVPDRRFWERAQKVALAAISGAVYAPVGLATHYHTIQIHPYWADSLTHVGTIGAHRFYRWRGAAGMPAAFTMAYAGHEPLPGRNPRSATSQPAPPDPVELGRIFDARLEAAAPQPAEPALRPASAAGRAPAYAPPPAYNAAVEARGGDRQFTASSLPKAGQVKDEFARSGSWIKQPGS